MEPNLNLKKGTILQINPSYKDFQGDFLILEEVGERLVHGYLALVYTQHERFVRYKGVAYLRIAWENIELVGVVKWRLEHKNEDEFERP